MRQIFTIGETVIDLIFKNYIPQAIKAGGSVLNATISLGRLGLPVKFISEFASDSFGDFINNFLKENNVDTSLIYRYTSGKTSVAIANLDDNNNAKYSFYKDLPNERIKIGFPEVNENDIVLFGSFYSINVDIHQQITDFIKFAKSKKAIIYYDPNYRKAHLQELDILKPMVLKNMGLADIVRGSDEDFSMIFGSNNADEAYSYVSKFCKNFIYTSSNHKVFAFNQISKTEIPVNKIEPISTIGAGDTFNAGIIYGIVKNNFDLKKLQILTNSEFENLITPAIEMATSVCLTFDNYIGNEVSEKYKLEVRS